MFIYITRGIHFDMPNARCTAHWTEGEAEASAFEMLAIIRADLRLAYDVEIEPPAPGTPFQPHLAYLRAIYHHNGDLEAAEEIVARACAQPELVEIEGTLDVWIEEIEIGDIPFAGPPASRTDAEIVAQANDLARDIFTEVFGYLVEDNFKVYDCVDPRAVKSWRAACIAFETLQQTPADEALENLRDEPERAADPLIETYLALSTAHLSEETADILDPDGEGVADWREHIAVIPYGEYGWFIPVPDVVECEGEEPFPAELIACFDLARAKGQGKILFDRDVSPIVLLQHFDW